MDKVRKYLNESRAKKLFHFKGTDEIGNFWVVTVPDKFSIMEDILFKTDVFGLALQLRGGLNGSEIWGIYKNELKASKEAEKLLMKLRSKSNYVNLD